MMLQMLLFLIVSQCSCLVPGGPCLGLYSNAIRGLTRSAQPRCVESYYDKRVRDERLRQAALEAPDTGSIPTSGTASTLQQAAVKITEQLSAKQDSARMYALKRSLMQLCNEVERGAKANLAQQEEIEELAKELEGMSPIKSPLQAPEINGRWQLIYTTSASILGIGRLFRPFGPIYQTINVPELSAENGGAIKWGPVRFGRWVKASLEPIAGSESQVMVRFKRFRIGFLRIPAPRSAMSELDTTYLDSNLRISRGGKGNVMILLKDDLPVYGV